MGAVYTIARMTFLEARRNRVFGVLVFFCLTMVLSGFLFQEVTITTLDRVLRDVGLGAADAFGLILSVFLGVSVVTREIERRTVYLLLGKPVSRGQYLLGKLLGVWLTIAVLMAMMVAAYTLEARLLRSTTPIIIYEAFWLMLVELWTISSFSVLSSTFTSSIMSAFLSLSLYVIGELSSSIYFLAKKVHVDWAKPLLHGIMYILPNFENLNLKDEASLTTPVPFTRV
ncbi:MAG: ABC transporter permease, partial [Thaumarchaeota archaeon]|nr:ABC transporter permease [Nitrososphaerota archaeon]